MGLGLIFVIVVVAFIGFAVFVSKAGPKVVKDAPDTQVEQENIGVGADEHEDPEGAKEPPMR